MARKERKKIIGFVPETTYGVDGLSAENIANGAVMKHVLGREFSITPLAGESQALEYDDGTLGQSAEIMTEVYVSVEFTVDLAASAHPAKAAPWGDLMAACLRRVTENAENSQTVYSIDDDATGSLTLYYYQSGTLHKVVGTRGSLAFNAAAKAFGGIKFAFTGLHVPAEAQAHPAPDFSTWLTPLKIGVQHSSFTIDGTAAKLISLEYDQANQVPYQEYVGHEEVMITDYQPTATMVIEAPKLIELDVFALAQAGEEHELVFTNGSIGNQVVWQSPRVQLGRPSYGEQDGTQTYSIPLRIISNADQFITR
ncbi:phage tail tube protein [Photobacterium sanguinicancri]|uniref:Phage tail protein n=1 Tax=Photobacterium sanguinicancri TaxID=875932 RepID=A0ABX4G1N3_9GAMM|nr:phage tail tube protein [Photobacterium sanguinicancri]OZS45068.1 hypothetical protein ASV53_05050 [Photobacterium sanguinicancri]